ncbi:MAG TPA: hypothetical protein VFW73_06905, partial [Lacipirellulaceae bacterium]|nr:hypothetical protein [Lacipirellulaceae bacterium]
SFPRFAWERVDAGTSPLLPLSHSPLLRCLLIWVALTLAGCQHAKPPAAQPRASVALRVLVVNEPGAVEAINRLHGEWAERSGGKLTAVAVEWKQVAAEKSLATDVVIFPSRYLGELCSRGWLRPMRSNVLESKEYDEEDVFPLVRRVLVRWGRQVMALPLSVDMALPVIASGKAISAQPAIEYLAAAAPTVISNERDGVLFDPQTMKPRIADPKFVAALQHWSQTTQTKIASETEAAPSVPVFGFDDRLIAVTTATRNAASAFQLVEWLASAEISAQLARDGSPSMPVRQSLASSSAWYGAGASAEERAKVAKALTSTLMGDKFLMIPRIPGVDEYLAALNDAVTAASSGKSAPKAALRRAADRWEKITDAHGREAQRDAYLKHLEITE